MIPTMLSKDSILSELDEIIGLTEDRPFSQKTRYLDVHTNFISYKMTAIFEYAFYKLSDELKLLCDYNEAEGLEACNEMLKVIEELESDDDCFVQSLLETVENIRRLTGHKIKISETNDALT